MSDTEIQPFYLLNYFKNPGVKKSVYVSWPFLMVVFVPVWERKTNPLAFSVVTTILNGLVLNCSKWKEKSYSFCFLQKRLWLS